MAQKTYSEMLKDPRWQRKRLEILNRSNFTCEDCGAADKTLHVHHKQYRKGALPWEYSDRELAALCEGCHDRRHTTQAGISDLLARMAPSHMERVFGYQYGIFWRGAIKHLADQLERVSINDTAIQLWSDEFAAGFCDGMGIEAFNVPALRAEYALSYERVLSLATSGWTVSEATENEPIEEGPESLSDLIATSRSRELSPKEKWRFQSLLAANSGRQSHG